MTTKVSPPPPFSTPRPLQFLGQVTIGQDFNSLLPDEKYFLEEVTGEVDDYRDYRHWRYDMNGDGVADVTYRETYWRDYPEYFIRSFIIEEGTNRDGPPSEWHHAFIYEGDAGDSTGTGLVAEIEDDDKAVGRAYWMDNNLDGKTDEELNESTNGCWTQLKDRDFDGVVDDVVSECPKR